MIQHHPNNAMLSGFVSGDLSNGVSIAVSTHLEYCPLCQDKVAELEAKSAETLLDASPVSDMKFDDMKQDMLAQILADDMSDVASAPDVVAQDSRHSEIVVNGHSYDLPRPLQHTNNQTGEWHKLIGNIWRAPVDLEGQERLNFIYMEKGGQIAEHTHTGTEITLVIAGSFADEGGEYVPGDFIVTDSSDKHRPFSKDRCLCFTVLDKPLHFTSGVARLLNPFSQLFF